MRPTWGYAIGLKERPQEFLIFDMFVEAYRLSAFLYGLWSRFEISQAHSLYASKNIWTPKIPPGSLIRP